MVEFWGSGPAESLTEGDFPLASPGPAVLPTCWRRIRTVNIDHWGVRYLGPDAAPGGWSGAAPPAPPFNSKGDVAQLLIAVPPWPLETIVERMPFGVTAQHQLWWRACSFATKPGASSWHLLTHELLENAEGMTIRQLRRRASGKKRLPSARVLAYALLAVHCKTGARPFAETSSVTADICVGGETVVVGGRDGWLGLHALHDETVDRRIGLVTETQ